MANNVSTLSDLPYDVKSGILVKLKDTRDILNVALTSHHFYDLAMPFLFRNVNWIVGFNQEERSPNATLEAVRFLCRHPEFLSATQSLRISEKNSGPDTDIRLPMNYSIREFPSLPGRRQCRLMDETFPPTFNMTQQTLSLLPFFTNLREMTLRSISLPRDFYQSVYELSTNHQLRSVTLRWCRLTTRFPRGYDPSMLQLRDLTILQVCHGPLTSLGKLKAVLKLARSQTLNTLRIDRSVEPALESLAQYGLPRSLENLELDFRGNAQRWRRSFEGLFRFLNNCFFVKHLELTDMGKLEGVRDYPSALKLKPDSLPSMVSFKGPASYLGLFVPCRPVNTITITDVITNHPPVVKYMKMEDVVEILQLLKRSRISLQTFRFNIRQWDRELFYMLSVMMRKASELYICYQAGVPDDDFFMSLGNLIEFPELERLYLYRPDNKMATADWEAFQDHQEYLIIWQRYMPKLREVAFCSDVIWTKVQSHAVSKDAPSSYWTRYTVEPMSGVEGLVCYPDQSDTIREHTWRLQGLPNNLFAF